MITALAMALANAALAQEPPPAVEAPVPAEAPVPSAAQAEHRRLSREMQEYAERNVWPGVEQAWKAIEALAVQGEVPASDELRLAAMSARAVGDVEATRQRLARAIQASPAEDLVVWLRDIDEHYAPVALDARAEAGAVLTVGEMPIEPDRRLAIERAQKALAAAGAFEGWLPEGTFTLGLASFDVVPGPNRIAVALAPPAPVPPPADAAPPPRKRRSLGIRATVGPAATALVTLDGVAQPGPPSFFGPGLRAGAGAEGRFSETLGWSAEAGYHAWIGNGAEALQGGYALLGPRIVVGRTAIGLTGGAFVGELRASGIADSDAVDRTCPYGTSDPECAWIARVPEADRASLSWTGAIRLPGGALDARVNLHEGLSAVGSIGSWVGPGVAIPWMQVGLGFGGP